jgi:hypothetical protein
MSQSPVYIEKVENINMVSYHPSLLLYLPADSISKTRINSEQELSPNSPNIQTMIPVNMTKLNKIQQHH